MEERASRVLRVRCSAASRFVEGRSFKSPTAGQVHSFIQVFLVIKTMMVAMGMDTGNCQMELTKSGQKPTCPCPAERFSFYEVGNEGAYA